MSDDPNIGQPVLRQEDPPATAIIDAQDPLPETDWFWRRLFTFIFTLLSIAFIWSGLASLQQLSDADSIYKITRYMIGVHVLLVTYYMVAPSAEQIIKIIQSAKLLRAGVPISRTAVVQTPTGGRAEVTTKAGTEIPVPPAPPTGGLDNLPEEAPWE